MAEQQGSKAERYQAAILAALRGAITQSLAKSKAITHAAAAASAAGEWEEMYHMLTAADKLHVSCSNLTQLGDYIQHAGELLGARILHHRHPWVQLAGARLLGRVLARVDPEAEGSKALGDVLKACGGAFLLIRGISAQVMLAWHL